MKQDAVDLFETDKDMVAFRASSDRRPLLAAIPVAVAMAAVVFVGVRGAHSTPDRPWTHQLADPTTLSGLHSHVAEPTLRT
jgi:hypothetical protein